MSSRSLPSSASLRRRHAAKCERKKTSLEAWNIIDKITQFIHAVGRVSGSRGSAILIAVPKADSTVPPPYQRQASTAHQPKNERWRRKQQQQQQQNSKPTQREVEEDDRLPTLGVLLTSSSVLPTREESVGTTVTFMEQPVAGTAAQLGHDPQPFSVAIRADCGFVCSVSPPARPSSGRTSNLDSDMDSEEEEEIGYTITYCDIQPQATMDEQQYSPSSVLPPIRFSQNRTCSRSGSDAAALSSARRRWSPRRASAPVDDLHILKPLPLPLLLSSIAPIRVGDVHMLVTHVNGHERHYLVHHVAEVYEDFCVYDCGNSAAAYDDCSGGPVFNMQGDFVGLQHQRDGQSICMRTSSIVRHLFQSNMLGLCCSPISILPLSMLEGGVITGCTTSVSPEVFNQPFGINQPHQAMDVGAHGDYILDFNEVERIRWLRENPAPVTLRVPSFEEVYAEFFTGFESLAHMLYAFSYCPQLCKKVLQVMVRKEYATDLATVAEGVGVILEMVDGHPHDEELVSTALAALGRLCLCESNLSTFVHVDGVVTVLEIMKEYSHRSLILQWGVYCLVQVTNPSVPRVEESIHVLVRGNGLELAVTALRMHGTDCPHLAKWIGQLISHVIEHDPRYLTVLTNEDLVALLLDCIQRYRENSFVLKGLLVLLRSMLQPYADRLLVFSSPVVISADWVPNKRGQLNLPDASRDPIEVSSFFIQQSLRHQQEMLWAVLVAVCDRDSRERLSDATDLLCTCLDLVAVLVRWRFLPSDSVVTAFRAACEQMVRVHLTAVDVHEGVTLALHLLDEI